MRAQLLLFHHICARGNTFGVSILRSHRKDFAMRFHSLAIAAALLQVSAAFQTPHTTKALGLRTPTFLSATVESSSTIKTPATTTHTPSPASLKNDEPAKEIEKELKSGKILEGGHVIDFEAVKGPSKAEQALADARKDILQRNGHLSPSIPDSILGINEDVVAEVGHPLGTFATAEQIQSCASYLRSKAPAGLLKDIKESSLKTFSEAQKQEYQKILRKAYEESGEVTGAYAKTFYMGTMLLPEVAREAIWAIYVWCRRTDEIVDAPRDDDKEMLLDLSSWEMRLEKLWNSGAVEDVYDLCLLDVRIKYPDMSITPFMDMIRGMLMDVPELGQDRYDTFDELHLYCYRVAGTVGLMSLPVFGTAQGISYEQARYDLTCVIHLLCVLVSKLWRPDIFLDIMQTENRHFLWALLFS